MNLYEAFVDELDKIALKYPPLGRMVRHPAHRYEQAKALKGVRKGPVGVRGHGLLEEKRKKALSAMSPSSKKFLESGKRSKAATRDPVRKKF